MTFPSLSASFLFLAFVFVTHAFDLSIIQMQQGTCPYTVVVMTSCLSPESTRDQISIVFGDADGNKVYAPKLGGSVRGAGGLGKCSTNTFQVRGQCLNDPICSLYINRNGPDGWVPESIEIYSEGSKSVKFDFSKSVPQINTWYGHNNCNTTGRPSSPDLPPPQFPPEFPPETPAIPPPPPPRPSAAARLGDGESVFLAFVIATAIAAMVRWTY
ncbi:embryo-specific protein 3 [Arabidopsis lyrata subsp. lyrata]|uniref:Embryo-specific protein 3 n=1 Tax=Arabidopsis lyrata subsp. lyrata TaxID=81972 RepID=D7M0G5_ARALL|nr:embryo-specific protein ATS3 isoform X1 [Arabidopsis lyrata subsp. lyrata]EFH47515.1 embryo-specific protein 3 [Arabidopsis lyrata subsp. lyrata]|eukprot:XP_020875864.1 embryo-specific protein ATS3 isoform X1 [Arabidopsis lyrata subsp. lyrata]